MRYVLALLLSLAATNVAAQEAASADKAPEGPITQPHDYRYGHNQIHERFHFPDATENLAPVDRRSEIDAASHRTILTAAALTPPPRTVQYSNFMLALHQLSFSPTDDLQLSATGKWGTPRSQPQVGLAAKIRLVSALDTAFSIQPFTFYRSATDPMDLDTSDFGLGLAALFDFFVTNRLAVTAGLTAYGTLWYGREEWNTDACESRADFLAGQCRDLRTVGQALPPGGHFLTAHVGATYYIYDQWALKGELLSGVVAGSLLASEFVVAAPDTFSDRARFEEGEIGVGVPNGALISAGLGLQWSNGLVAVQFSGYVYPAEPLNVPDHGVLFTPMLNGAVAF